MHHTVAYRASLTAGAVDSALTIISGGDTVQNGMYYPPNKLDLIWASSFGTNIVNPWLVTPTLREMGNHYLRPINIATPYGSNFSFDEIVDRPLTIDKNDPIDVRASNVDAGTQVANVLLGLRFSNEQISGGRQWRRVMVTGTQTATANVWTPTTLTFANGLPPGRYAIVGAQLFGTTMYAFRLVIPNQYWKPGAPTFQTIGQRLPDRMNQWKWGVWGYFDQSSLPAAEILCTAGDTAQTGWIDIVKM